MEKITVETIIAAPVSKVWEYWNEPHHIVNWCHASEDWHSPKATNDLTIGGKSTTRMESRDGMVGFDFGGTYTDVVESESIEYVMNDGRAVRIDFSEQDGGTRVVESFDPESENPIEMQKAGWQAILENFKKYVESN